MTNHVPEATKPASGDYAWLGAEAGSVADLMYMLNTEDWYDAINSRFVSELLDDTLPESILKAYLIQDFKFYNNGMMARLIKLAPRQETKDMLAAQSQWFADNEATYFEHFLEAYHVSQEEYDATEPTPANKEYGAYLDSLSDKSWPELINALCCRNRPSCAILLSAGTPFRYRLVNSPWASGEKVMSPLPRRCAVSLSPLRSTVRSKML